MLLNVIARQHPEFSLKYHIGEIYKFMNQNIKPNVIKTGHSSKILICEK